jgi:hypothetical protein
LETFGSFGSFESFGSFGEWPLKNDVARMVVLVRLVGFRRSPVMIV